MSAGVELTVATTSALGPSQPAALVHDTQNDVVVVMLGVVNGEPVPMDEPPLDAAYQVRVPVQPEAVKLTVPGPQRELGPAVGAPGIALTVATTSVLGPSQPAALVHDTQNDVVVVMLVVVNGEPVPMDEPPLDAAYQVRVPVQPDAPNTTVPVPHREPSIPVGADGIGFTVIFRGADVLVQLLASVTCTV